MGIYIEVRWWLIAIASDLGIIKAGDRNTQKHHKRILEQTTGLKKIASYFWQLLESFYPSAFFPGNRDLPFDRIRPFWHYPKDSPFQLIAYSHEYGQWKNAINHGTTFKDRWIDRFPDTSTDGAIVTIWQEYENRQLTITKSMGGGIFIVGGTPGPTLGLGALPQYVSRIELLWDEDRLVVRWHTEIGELISRWRLENGFIFTGVADAGLAKALLIMKEKSLAHWPTHGPKSWSLHAIDCVSLTAPSTEEDPPEPRRWETQVDALPSASSYHAIWSIQGAQWARRVRHALRSRAVNCRKSWFSNLRRASKSPKSIFQGLGMFLAEVQFNQFSDAAPRPRLTVAPLVLEAVAGPRPARSLFFTSEFGRVQKSLIEKWHWRTRPSCVPTLLCDIQNDFELVEEVPPGADYIAISYRWEQFEEFEALKTQVREVASELQARYAWIDRWCIKQDDEAMKANEILKMSGYYSKASAVVVLLPDVDSTTSSTHLENGRPFDLQQARKQDARLAHEIVNSQWRSRVWTIQEGLLAQNSIVKTRHQMLDGEYLDHILHVPYHCWHAKFACLGQTFAPLAIPSLIVNVRAEWSVIGITACNCTFGNRLWWSAGDLHVVVRRTRPACWKRYS